MPLTYHRIKESHLDLLCHGYASAELIDDLWRSEFSRRKIVLLSLVDLIGAEPALLGPLPALAGSLDLLMAVDESDPDVFRDVLMHPQVGSWLAYVLRRSQSLVETTAPSWVDAGMLHALAFVAAVRSGRDWKTTVPARSGRAMFPGLGMAVFPEAGAWNLVEAETCAGRLTFRCDGRPGDARWWELRRLRVGTDPVLAMTFDDIDPYRDLGDPVAPQRLPAADVARWHSLLADAWDVICTRHRACADAMAGGLASLVPLADGGTETRSASTGEAFGSVLVSEPDDALSLAVALIHEFAHIRLGGLLHLLPVTAGGEREIYYAPWRDDPRHLPGLAQGIFAFVNIAAFWRREAGAGPSFEYALTRLQAEQALAIAASSGVLTEIGERLVDGLADRVAGWEPVAGEPARVARLVAATHRAGWRIRHLRPAGEAVDGLVAAWSRGEDAPALDPAYQVVPGQKIWSQGRLALARRFIRTGDATPTGGLRSLGVDDADAQLLRGENAAAAFTGRILADPGDLDAWSGLAVAAEGSAAHALTEHPALVHAVYRGSQAADPVALAAWLGRSV